MKCCLLLLRRTSSSGPFIASENGREFNTGLDRRLSEARDWGSRREVPDLAGSLSERRSGIERGFGMERWHSFKRPHAGPLQLSWMRETKLKGQKSLLRISLAISRKCGGSCRNPCACLKSWIWTRRGHVQTCERGVSTCC
jgi:hypothetical protein